jgi:transposase
MGKGYLKVIRERAGDAAHVLDRYHIMAWLNKAIDKVRADEARRMKEDGYEPILKHSRWCLLKRPVNLTGKQVVKLKEPKDKLDHLIEALDELDL